MMRHAELLICVEGILIWATAWRVIGHCSKLNGMHETSQKQTADQVRNVVDVEFLSVGKSAGIWVDIK